MSCRRTYRHVLVNILIQFHSYSHSFQLSFIVSELSYNLMLKKSYNMPNSPISLNSSIVCWLRISLYSTLSPIYYFHHIVIIVFTFHHNCILISFIILVSSRWTLSVTQYLLPIGSIYYIVPAFTLVSVDFWIGLSSQYFLSHLIIPLTYLFHFSVQFVIYFFRHSLR